MTQRPGVPLHRVTVIAEDPNPPRGIRTRQAGSSSGAADSPKPGHAAGSDSAGRLQPRLGPHALVRQAGDHSDVIPRRTAVLLEQQQGFGQVIVIDLRTVLTEPVPKLLFAAADVRTAVTGQ